MVPFPLTLEDLPQLSYISGRDPLLGWDRHHQTSLTPAHSIPTLTPAPHTFNLPHLTGTANLVSRHIL